MGNLNSSNKDDINKCIQKNISLIPKKDTFSKYCKTCDKYFYVNNNNKCNFCIFSHREFCVCKNDFYKLEQLNSLCESRHKKLDQLFCINYCETFPIDPTSIYKNQLYISELFKYCKKNNAENTKLNEEIVFLDKRARYLENEIKNKNNEEFTKLNKSRKYLLDSSEDRNILNIMDSLNAKNLALEDKLNNIMILLEKNKIF